VALVRWLPLLLLQSPGLASRYGGRSDVGHQVWRHDQFLLLSRRLRGGVLGALLGVCGSRWSCLLDLQVAR
jgi:hypothetical protein